MNYNLIFSKTILRTSLTVCAIALSSQLICAEIVSGHDIKKDNITYIVKQSSVEEAFEELSKITGFHFFYDESVLKDLGKVNIKVKAGSIDAILKELSQQTGLNFRRIDQTISVSRQHSTINEVKQVKQSKKITGVIRDNNGEPIIGANVTVKGTTNGTITDLNGNFTIEADAKSILHISYIGYLSKEVPVGNQKSIQVVLLEDAKKLDEVVVIGYGTQKKADLTGSVANVNAEKLNVQSNVNIGQALQGKIAGVDIVSQGGNPGAGFRVMVRGIGTLNNATPLYIVDGMYMNNIDHINPNDIASIDVLKDASSAAIYGSRAANGVIIVTTKEGSNTEGKPIVDLSINVGVQAPSKYLDMLDAKGWAEVTTVARQAVNRPALDMATDLANKPDNDWQRIMLGPALMQNYNASIKGGGKYSTYYTGLGYFNQDGIVKGTNYERFTLQSKNDYKKGIFSAGTNILLTFNHDKPLHEESRGGMVGTILQTVPTLEKYDESREGGYGGLYGDVVNIPNPLGMVDNQLMNRYNENMKVYANFYAQLEFIKGLKYKLNLTPDFDFSRYKKYLNKYDFGLASNSVTQLTERQRRSRNILVENLLTYDKTFGDHKVSALVGYTYQDSRFRHLQAYGENLPDGLQEIDASTTSRSNEGYSIRSVLTSILGRIFYSYKNKYLCESAVENIF